MGSDWDRRLELALSAIDTQEVDRATTQARAKEAITQLNAVGHCALLDLLGALGGLPEVDGLARSEPEQALKRIDSLPPEHKATWQLWHTVNTGQPLTESQQALWDSWTRPLATLEETAIQAKWYASIGQWGKACQCLGLNLAETRRLYSDLAHKQDQITWEIARVQAAAERACEESKD